jgi:hypothetical protein
MSRTLRSRFATAGSSHTNGLGGTNSIIRSAEWDGSTTSGSYTTPDIAKNDTYAVYFWIGPTASNPANSGDWTAQTATVLVNVSSVTNMATSTIALGRISGTTWNTLSTSDILMNTAGVKSFQAPGATVPAGAYGSDTVSIGILGIQNGGHAVGTFTVSDGASTYGLFPNFSLTPPPNAGSGAGTVSMTGTAAGARDYTGAGAGTVSMTGTAAGSADREGAGAGTVSLTGTAVGSSPNGGAGSGTVSTTGTANGTQPVIPPNEGAGSGTVSMTGTADGSATHAGTGSGTVDLTGTAAGSFDAAGTGSGTVSMTGTANGLQPSGAPDAPTLLQVTAVGETSVSLQWQDNSDDETGFRVEWTVV